MKRLFPILGVITAVLLSYALYEALVAAPTEKTMGDIQRIFYYHVPSAWTAFLLFFINFLASTVYLLRRSPGSLKLAARIGHVLAVLSILTVVFWPGYSLETKISVFQSLLLTLGIVYLLFWLLSTRTNQEQV